MNVLVYSGLGTTVESVKHCVDTLRLLLSPHYAVMPVSAELIVKEPWTSACALLCIPGGADLGYCKSLNGEGNRRISQYVRRGGKYIGFCAGAYYASAEIEFEKGDPSMEVSGKRELRFFPGLCRGTAFKGFRYNSEAGARACALDVSPSLVAKGASEKFSCYYNGGGFFVGADALSEQGVEVLARYQDKLDIDNVSHSVAAVGCKIGSGYAVLIQAHPEFAATAMKKRPGLESSNVLSILEENEGRRLMFMSSCLSLLGLKTHTIETDVPQLSALHLSFSEPQDAVTVLENLKSLTDPIHRQHGLCLINGENDVFLLDDHPDDKKTPTDTIVLDSLQFGDEYPAKTVLQLKLYTNVFPNVHDTPSFDIASYFGHLEVGRNQYSRMPFLFGSSLLYGEVVTSTNTILDKNFKVLQKLPSGLTAVATIQIAGRGRGNNVWVSPVGSLVFSTFLRHKLGVVQTAPVVFLQYLVALAIVHSVKSYGPGYEELIDREEDSRSVSEIGGFEIGDKGYVKIGGILVNASFAGDEFLLVVGCGINTSNDAPTTSLNRLLESVNQGREAKNLPPLEPYKHEELLARILVTFEIYYNKFLQSGFSSFEPEYYRHWLHRDQIVTIESMNGCRARVRGISIEDGMLVVDELDSYNNRTGQVFNLQTDGNSFDFFNGLLKRKT